MIKIKTFFIGIFVLMLIIPFYSSSGEAEIEVQEGEISVETNPSNPQPYQDVTINISSYATDLNKAIITWQIGLNTVLTGIGKTKYTLKTDGVDTSIVININIKPIGSINTIIKKVVIIPSEIELMWESYNGYTPPFYKGKTLPTNGSLIKVIAIPNTKIIKTGVGNFSYTWKNNDEVNIDASGYNKNAYIYKNSLFEESNTVTVLVSSIGGNYSGENTIEIPLYKPELIFYKKSPTEGILYGQALNKEVLFDEGESTIVAEPYFLSLKENEENFSYTWKINNEIIDTPYKKREITIKPISKSGYATISLMISNVNDLFQKVSNQLKIKL